MNFNVGDKVKVIDETSEGIILRFELVDKAVVEIDSFEYSYNLSKLILLESYYPVIISEREIREKEAEPEKKVSQKHKKGAVIEVDLHIHELVDSAIGMSNSDMLLLQLSKFRKELERAISDRANKVVFIHFNHTNPVIDPDSYEAKTVTGLGFKIGKINDIFEL